MCGPPGEGKTTALNMVLEMSGGISERLVINVTRPAILGFCAAKLSVTIGLDDPSSLIMIKNLCVDLYNGAQKLSVCQGSAKPRTTMIVAANNSISNNHRWDG